MNRWKEILISPATPILKAIEIIDASSLQIALVVDDINRLMGTVSDGDIRRGILKGIPLGEPVQTIMFTDPTVAGMNDGRENILSMMKARQIRQIPVVDAGGRVIGLEKWDDLVRGNERENIVVLMAGGLGSRLGDLTKSCPKPLLKVGDKPVIESIIESCREYGFHKFYMSVNYKAEMLQDYFGDGSRMGIDIQYIRENSRLGTAGALGLLQVKTAQPLLIINADVMTKVNFQQLMDFHVEHNASATMCVKEYDFQVPYGVVKIDGGQLVGIEEKPVQHFFVSAGIYVFNPEVLQHIPRDQYLDMPVLFENLLKYDIATSVFPIREYWLDIGKVDDYERANSEYSSIFCNSN